MIGKRIALASALTSALAVLPTLALAQQDEAAQTRWTTANVLPDKPFGDIDVSAAGTTASQAKTFLDSLSGREVVELLSRCNVISPVALRYGRADKDSGSDAANARPVDPEANNAADVADGHGPGGAGNDPAGAGNAMEDIGMAAGSNAANRAGANGNDAAVDIGRQVLDEAREGNARVNAGGGGAAASAFPQQATTLCNNINDAIFAQNAAP